MQQYHLKETEDVPTLTHAVVASLHDLLIGSPRGRLAGLGQIKGRFGEGGLGVGTRFLFCLKKEVLINNIYLTQIYNHIASNKYIIEKKN